MESKADDGLMGNQLRGMEGEGQRMGALGP